MGRCVIGMVGGWYWLMILYSGRLWCEWCWTSGFCYQRAN